MKETAVIIAYDDSDGWYDHQMGPIVHAVAWKLDRSTLDDQLLGPGNCGTPRPAISLAELKTAAADMPAATVPVGFRLGQAETISTTQ